MIKFKNLCQETPYLLFEEKYNKALESYQKNIESMCVSSFSVDKKEVNARFVNIKFLNQKEFIFFSNYESPKAKDFLQHNQISGLFFWNNTNMQVRIKANIKKTNSLFNQKYFYNRDKKKNALAISSIQSVPIQSYEAIQRNYKNALGKDELSKCPEYWGGFSFIPYYFEFWEGHESRINKREVFEKVDAEWKQFIIQP
jgi:pyridoxamine 5'-phosphate oxidase